MSCLSSLEAILVITWKLKRHFQVHKLWTTKNRPIKHLKFREQKTVDAVDGLLKLNIDILKELVDILGNTLLLSCSELKRED